MGYTIKRECWNEKTFNGYIDNPYWAISFESYRIGLKDNGEFWSIINGQSEIMKQPHIKERLETIISECKLKIKIKVRNETKN